MVKIAIVEDSIKDSEILKGYVKRYSDEKGVDFDVKCFSDGDVFSSSFSGEYDILLLDIDLPGKNGIDVAKEVRKTDNRVCIAFITNLAQYAIEGYNVEACAFILKPYIYEDFVLKLIRILKLCNKEVESIITIEGKSSTYNVPVSEIFYVEVFGHYLTYHTKSKNYISRDTMNNIENKLSSFNFYRISNAYLVNMQCINKIEKDDVYINEDILKISRQKKQAFLTAFMNIYGGR